MLNNNEHTAEAIDQHHFERKEDMENEEKKEEEDPLCVLVGSRSQDLLPNKSSVGANDPFFDRNKHRRAPVFDRYPPAIDQHNRAILQEEQENFGSILKITVWLEIALYSAYVVGVSSMCIACLVAGRFASPIVYIWTVQALFYVAMAIVTLAPFYVIFQEYFYILDKSPSLLSLPPPHDTNNTPTTSSLSGLDIHQRPRFCSDTTMFISSDDILATAQKYLVLLGLLKTPRLRLSMFAVLLLVCLGADTLTFHFNAPENLYVIGRAVYFFCILIATLFVWFIFVNRVEHYRKTRLKWQHDHHHQLGVLHSTLPPTTQQQQQQQLTPATNEEAVAVVPAAAYNDDNASSLSDDNWDVAGDFVVDGKQQLSSDDDDDYKGSSAVAPQSTATTTSNGDDNDLLPLEAAVNASSSSTDRSDDAVGVTSSAAGDNAAAYYNNSGDSKSAEWIKSVTNSYSGHHKRSSHILDRLRFLAFPGPSALSGEQVSSGVITPRVRRSQRRNTTPLNMTTDHRHSTNDCHSQRHTQKKNHRRHHSPTSLRKSSELSSDPPNICSRTISTTPPNISLLPYSSSDDEGRSTPSVFQETEEEEGEGEHCLINIRVTPAPTDFSCDSSCITPSSPPPPLLPPPPQSPQIRQQNDLPFAAAAAEPSAAIPKETSSVGQLIYYWFYGTESSEVLSARSVPFIIMATWFFCGSYIALFWFEDLHISLVVGTSLAFATVLLLLLFHYWQNVAVFFDMGYVLFHGSVLSHLPMVLAPLITRLFVANRDSWWGAIAVPVVAAVVLHLYTLVTGWVLEIMSGPSIFPRFLFVPLSFRYIFWYMHGLTALNARFIIMLLLVNVMQLIEHGRTGVRLRAWATSTLTSTYERFANACSARTARCGKVLGCFGCGGCGENWCYDENDKQRQEEAASSTGGSSNVSDSGVHLDQEQLPPPPPVPPITLPPLTLPRTPVTVPSTLPLTPVTVPMTLSLTFQSSRSRSNSQSRSRSRSNSQSKSRTNSQTNSKIRMARQPQLSTILQGLHLDHQVNQTHFHDTSILERFRVNEHSYYGGSADHAEYQLSYSRRQRKVLSMIFEVRRISQDVLADVSAMLIVPIVVWYIVQFGSVETQERFRFSSAMLWPRYFIMFAFRLVTWVLLRRIMQRRMQTEKNDLNWWSVFGDGLQRPPPSSPSWRVRCTRVAQDVLECLKRLVYCCMACLVRCRQSSLEAAAPTSDVGRGTMGGKGREREGAADAVLNAINGHEYQFDYNAFRRHVECTGSIDPEASVSVPAPVIISAEPPLTLHPPQSTMEGEILGGGVHTHNIHIGLDARLKRDVSIGMASFLQNVNTPKENVLLFIERWKRDIGIPVNDMAFADIECMQYVVTNLQANLLYFGACTLFVFSIVVGSFDPDRRFTLLGL